MANLSEQQILNAVYTDSDGNSISAVQVAQALWNAVYIEGHQAININVKGGIGPSGSKLGAWTADFDYSAGDIVNYQGALYTALQSGAGQNPATATDYWEAYYGILGEKLTKRCWFAVVDQQSGTIGPVIDILGLTGTSGTGAEYYPAQFPAGVDALCCEVSDGDADLNSGATDGDGVPITVSSFTETGASEGAYVLSGVPTGDVAIVFCYAIKWRYYNANFDLVGVDLDDAAVGGGSVSFGGEPPAVSSSTSGTAGSNATASRSDHSHDLGEHAHTGATNGGTIALSSTTVSGLTTGHFLKATGAAAFGFAAHGLVANDFGFGSDDSPTLTGLTLSGLTAGRVVVSDADKALASLSLIGHISGCQISVKDVDEFYVDAGTVDLSGTLHTITSQLTKTVTGLSASTTYHVYLKPPASGVALSATEIEYNTTAPTYDSSKGAGYHGTNTTWRWVGWFESDASSYVSAAESVQEFNAKTVGQLEEFLVRETAPFGRIELNGAAVSRTTYADLYRYSPASLATAFGVGDGSTTFTLPDLRGQFPRIWDHAKGVDLGAASRTDRGDGTTGDHPGTKEAHATEGLYSRTAISGSSIYQQGAASPSWSSTIRLPGSASVAATTSFTTSSAIGTLGTGETCPVNINVAVFCKYIRRL